MLADSPYLFWEMQDAALPLQDSSGNNRNGNAVNGTPDFQAAGPMGALAVHFAAGEFISNNAGQAPNVTNNFTLECFFYRMVDAQVGHIWVAGTTGGSGWSIYQNSNTKFLGLANGVALLADSANSTPLNNWCHLVVVRDAGVWKYYFNGAVDDTDAGNTAPNAPTDLNVIVGAAFSSLEMRVAYAAIYNTVLSPARVAAHYAASGL